MAQLLLDGFDHYATADITAKWTSTAIGVNTTLSISSSAGRRSGSGFRVTCSSGAGAFGYIKKTVAASGVGFVCGFYIKRSAAPGGSGDYLVSIAEGSTTHVSLRWNSDYTFSVVRGDGTVLGTSGPSGFSDSIGGFVEWKGTIDDSTGSYTVRANMTNILVGSSKDTKNGLTGAWNGCWLGIVNSQTLGAITLDFDDFYLLDQSGGVDDDFYGEGRIDVRTITGAGTTTQYTPSTGSNYQNVDDTAPNTSDYNSDATVGNIDTFAMQDAPVSGAGIKAVQISIYAQKSDAGSRSLSAVIRHSGTDYATTAQALSTAWGYLLYQLGSKNPGTAAAWVEADFNAAEPGYKTGS